MTVAILAIVAALAAIVTVAKFGRYLVLAAIAMNWV
jgi:membrane protein YqaA with SNARE-associated domain